MHGGGGSTWGREGIVSNPLREGVCVDAEDWGHREALRQDSQPSPFKRRPRPAGRRGLVLMLLFLLLMR